MDAALAAGLVAASTVLALRFFLYLIDYGE